MHKNRKAVKGTRYRKSWNWDGTSWRHRISSLWKFKKQKQDEKD